MALHITLVETKSQYHNKKQLQIHDDVIVRKRWSVRHVRNRKKISLVSIYVSIDAMGKGEILLMGRNRITLSLRFFKIIYVICICLCMCVLRIF